MKILIIILIFSLLLTGGVCEMIPTPENINEQDVLGTYYANFSSGLLDEIKIIKSDSIYIRTFINFENQKYIDSGYWRSVIHDSDYINIILSNFKKRYTVDTLEVLRSFTEKSSYVDSSANDLWLRVWKYGNGKRIFLGEPYGKAWDKVSK